MYSQHLRIEALNVLLSETRFKGEHGKVGNLATNEPGDPKIIALSGGMVGDHSSLMGDSDTYRRAHGADP